MMMMMVMGNDAYVKMKFGEKFAMFREYNFFSSSEHVRPFNFCHFTVISIPHHTPELVSAEREISKFRNRISCCIAVLEFVLLPLLLSFHISWGNQSY